MNVRVEMTDGGTVAIASIGGELDLANGPSFADNFLGRLPDAAEALVIDLSDLRYIDSIGVRSLFDIAAALRRRDQRLAIVVPEGSIIASVLRITRIEDVAQISASQPDALAHVSAVGRE